jgi:hypothetical protein
MQQRRKLVGEKRIAGSPGAGGKYEAQAGTA